VTPCTGFHGLGKVFTLGQLPLLSSKLPLLSGLPLHNSRLCPATTSRASTPPQCAEHTPTCTRCHC